MFCTILSDFIAKQRIASYQTHFLGCTTKKTDRSINTILDLYEESGAKDFEAFSMKLTAYQEKQIAYLILHRFLGQQMFFKQLSPFIEKEELTELEDKAFG